MGKKTVTVTFADGKAMEFSRSETLFEISRACTFQSGNPLLAARIKQSVRSLSETIEGDTRIEWITYDSPEGMEIYQRTASFILFMAVSELYDNSRLAIGHSIANGFYYDLHMGIPVNQQMLAEISEKMKEIIHRDLPFRRIVLEKPEAARFFSERSMSDSRRLIEYADIAEAQIYENGRFANFELYPLAYSTGVIAHFELKSYYPGFVMLFPEQKDFTSIPPVGNTRKLFEIYQESKTWGKILGVNDIGRLNEVIARNGASELIKISESLHEKKIARIADMIGKRKDEIRLILIAGPSGSGKTTFSKRLTIHLLAIGIRPFTLFSRQLFRRPPALPQGRERQSRF